MASSSRERHGGFRLPHMGVLVVVLAIVLTMAAAFRVSASNSLPSPGWAVSAAPINGVLDGEVVGVNVQANSDVPVYSIQIRECRLGPAYTTPLELSPRSGNCPVAPVSSSADVLAQKSASDNLIALAQADGGYTINYHVGAGTTTWDTPTGSVTLTCGVDHPCALVALVEAVSGENYTPQIFTLNFKNDDPLAACGGTATGALKAGASDELSDAWAGWTRDYCSKHTGGAPSVTSFGNEGDAVKGLADGSNDLAYGSAGTDPATGMLSPDSPKRDTVAVPIGLNAAVLAVGGGRHDLVDGVPFGDKKPYPQLQMTVADAAAMLSNGRPILQDSRFQYAASITSTNPALDGIAYLTGSDILAPAPPLTSTWLLTSYFSALTPGDWVDHRTDPATSRLATSALATAVPDFQRVQTLTGRPAFLKITFPASLNLTDGPLWVFTDRVSAEALKLKPVALQNANGTAFVAPDNASMSAAVADMKPNAAGVLQPVIKAADASSGVGAAATEPYPLTYVEYAFVPAEPLVDPATCNARTTSQTLLTDWLTYIIGEGQQNLPAGLEPLPESLQSQAAAAIAKVGTSPTTGACAGKVTPENTAPPGGTQAPGANNTPTVPSAQSFQNVTQPPNAAAANAAAQAAEQQQKAAAVAIPAFAGHTLADPVGGVVALIGIVLVMSLAAWITAGGSLANGTRWTPGSTASLTPSRVASLALLWGGVGLAGLGLVLFQLGPLLAQRDQRSLLSSYKREISSAAYEGQGLGGTTEKTTAPARGTPVGIIEIGALQLQNVVVEGVTPSQTREGPGHVPGTSGLGQPGNSVVVARRNGYGGAFAGLGLLVKGDRIVVTTTQGQSVYAVRCVNQETVEEPSDQSSTGTTATSASTSSDPCSGKSGAAAAAPTPGASTTTAPSAGDTTTTTTTGAAPTTTTASVAAAPGGGTQALAAYHRAADSTPRRTLATTIDALYGPSQADQLTLVTSGQKSPLNSSTATVVVAKLLSKPFPPTNQNGRSDGETGFQSDPGALSSVVLALLAFVGVIVASVALYRKMRFRIAYVLTIAPLVALTVVTGEALARLLPAWT